MVAVRRRPANFEFIAEPLVFALDGFPVNEECEPLLERQRFDAGLSPLLFECLCHAGEAERSQAIVGRMCQHFCAFLEFARAHRPRSSGRGHPEGAGPRQLVQW